jgi:beta-lactamase class A
MIRVMDGVRPTQGHPAQPAVSKPKRVVATPLPARPRANGMRMDVLRRPPLIKQAQAINQPSQNLAAELSTQFAASLKKPKLYDFTRLRTGWRRPAMAIGLALVALTASGLAVAALSNPQNVAAHASSERPTGTPSNRQSVAISKPAATPNQGNGLQALLSSFVNPYPGKFAIVVKNMTTGETASIDPNRQVESASLYKLFVAQRIYQQIDLGQLSPSQSAGSGSGSSINDCLTVMINISDNTCGRALGGLLGWGNQNQALSVEGYKETDLSTPQKTSAADVGTLFTRLYDGTLLSSNSSAKFLALLKDQRVNNRLPVGLPAGTVIAHKTGDLDGVVHDAGIVYGPKSNYEIVVLSTDWNTPGNAPQLISNLSQQVWNYFEY